MITQINEDSIRKIEDIIKGIITSGSEKEVRINFNGGTSKKVEDLGSFVAEKRQIIVDKQFLSVKNITNITHGDEKIIIFPW